MLLKGSTCSSLVSSVNLRLSLRWGESAAFVIRVVYADIIRCAVCLIAESETDVHQTTAPTATCQFVGAPIHVHGQVKIAGADAINLEWLFITGG